MAEHQQKPRRKRGEKGTMSLCQDNYPCTPSLSIQHGRIVPPQEERYRLINSDVTDPYRERCSGILAGGVQWLHVVCHKTLLFSYFW